MRNQALWNYRWQKKLILKYDANGNWMDNSTDGLHLDTKYTVESIEDITIKWLKSGNSNLIKELEAI